MYAYLHNSCVGSTGWVHRKHVQCVNHCAQRRCITEKQCTNTCTAHVKLDAVL